MRTRLREWIIPPGLKFKSELLVMLTAQGIEPCQFLGSALPCSGAKFLVDFCHTLLRVIQCGRQQRLQRLGIE